jgi:hypothetical protein
MQQITPGGVSMKYVRTVFATCLLILCIECRQSHSSRIDESKPSGVEATAHYLHSMTLQWEKTIGKIETDLNLGKPVSIRNPEATDPYYWIAYRKPGYEVLLTAMVPPEKESDSCDSPAASSTLHRDWLFGSFYRLRLTEGQDGERPIDWNREAEFPVCYSSMNRFPPNDVPKKIWLYFTSLNHRKKIRVTQIEKELNLGAPKDVHLSHGTDWITWFFYDLGDNLTVGIGVTRLPELETANSDPEDHSSFVFAGYWNTCRDQKIDLLPINPKGS